MKWLKMLWCSHKRIRFIRNIYGDEINLFNARSEHKCDDCGKRIYKATLV